MKQRPLALGVVIVAASVAPLAQAQVTSSTMVQGRQAREVEIHAIGRVEYNTNVSRASKAAPPNPSVKPEDTIYSPTLDVNVVQPLGQQAVFLRGRVGYNFHDVNKRLDHSRVNLIGGLGNRLGPCGSVLTGSYSRSRSELDDLTLVQNVQNLLEVKTVGIDLTCQRPPGFGVTLGASRSWGDNSQLSTRMADFETSSAQVGLVYSRPQAGSISVFGAYTRNEYPNRPTLSGDTEGYEQIAGGVSVDRRLGARIQGTVSVSYAHVALLSTPLLLPGATNSGTDKFNGLTYSARVNYRASSRLRANVAFDRSISPTLVTNQSYEVRTGYEANVDYQLGSRIQLSAGAQQSDVDTRGADLSAPTALTDAKTRIYRSSVRYRQSQRLSLSLEAAHEKRKTNNSLFDYKADRVGVTADVSF